MEQQNFSYNRGWYKSIGFMIGVLLPVFFIWTFVINGDVNTFLSLRFIGWFFLYVVWTPLAVLLVLFLFPDIKIDNEGLLVEFGWKFLRVPWSDLVEITQAKFFGLGMVKRTFLVVTKNKMTIFHRLYGWIYGFKGNASFLPSPDIHGYKHLMDEMSKQVKQNHRLKQ